MINIKSFDPNRLKMIKILFRDVLSINIYHIKSLDHVDINNENFLYSIFNNVDGYIEESTAISFLFLQMKTKKH